MICYYTLSLFLSCYLSIFQLSDHQHFTINADVGQAMADLDENISIQRL